MFQRIIKYIIGGKRRWHVYSHPIRDNIDLPTQVVGFAQMYESTVVPRFIFQMLMRRTVFMATCTLPSWRAAEVANQSILKGHLEDHSKGWVSC